MKKWLVAILCGIVLTGCSSGVSQEEYESVVAERDALEAQAESASAEIDALKSEKESVQSEYNTYKEKMSEYEGLANAEAEARQIQAESVIAAEQAAKEQAEAESKAAKEAEEEEEAGYDTGITYDQLARTPDDFKGEKVKFSGKVVQVVEGDTSNAIRFAVNSDYDNMLYCEYDKDIVSARVLDNDMITIYGISYGLYSYESTMGAKITIPAVIIDKIEQ